MRAVYRAVQMWYRAVARLETPFTVHCSVLNREAPLSPKVKAFFWGGNPQLSASTSHPPAAPHSLSITPVVPPTSITPVMLPTTPVVLPNTPVVSHVTPVVLPTTPPPVRQRSVSTRTITTDRKWYPRGSGAAQTARRNMYAVHSADLHAAPGCLTRPMAQRQHTKRRTRRCAV